MALPRASIARSARAAVATALAEGATLAMPAA